jgi:rare lipoprotein A
MKWRAEALVLAALAAPVAAQDGPPEGPGPRATSNQGERYDAVGYVGAGDQGNGVAHASLPVGSYVEVTALDSGRTALFAVTATKPSSGDLVTLSADAMTQLGVQPGAGVRVRDARPTPPEVAALRAGGTTTLRLDAPPVLLTGLRKELPVRGRPAPTIANPPRNVEIPASSSAQPAPASPAPRGAPIPVPPPTAPPPARPAIAPKPAVKSGWGVQVAALSNEARAKALAAELGGTARSAGNIWRIQLGPFNDRAEAESARARVAGRGHPQATIVHIP